MRPIRALKNNKAKKKKKKNNKARRLKQSENYSEAVIALFCPLLIFLSLDKSSCICKKKKKYSDWLWKAFLAMKEKNTNCAANAVPHVSGPFPMSEQR